METEGVLNDWVGAHERSRVKHRQEGAQEAAEATETAQAGTVTPQADSRLDEALRAYEADAKDVCPPKVLEQVAATREDFESMGPEERAEVWLAGGRGYPVVPARGGAGARLWLSAGTSGWSGRRRR